MVSLPNWGMSIGGTETRQAMELTRDKRAILEVAMRAGEISPTGAARAVETSGVEASRHETQRAAGSALRELVERGYLQEAASTRELFVPTPEGRSAAKAAARR